MVSKSKVTPRVSCAFHHNARFSFFILEPGYYEEGSFGIRIETAVVVVNASTPVSNILASP